MLTRIEQQGEAVIFVLNMFFGKLLEKGVPTWTCASSPPALEETIECC